MKLGNRYSQHSFAQVPQVKMARSKFDRSFAAKDTFNFDKLTPCFIDEVLPGDTINLNVKSFARLATQVVPMMDNMYIDYFFFFVPNRLVWQNWERFNGAQDTPTSSTDFIIPTIKAPASTGFTVGSIYDKLGIPTGVPDLEINALPLRAYNLIWREWFRDQNLQNPPAVTLTDGPDNPADYSLLNRAKKHDYFTSCLPWPQKGDAVTMPMGGFAPVTGHLGTVSEVGDPNNRLFGTASYASGVIQDGTSTDFGYDIPYGDPAGALNQNFLQADLSQATAATINQLRLAMMTQSLLELDARGGTRYTEILRAHFNVVSPDFRLQRPEFLSGGTTFMSQHPVAQTSGTEVGSTPQANLAAFSTAAEMGNKIGFSKSFTEHGYVIGIMQARGDVTYQQGLNKLWSRQTRFDFFWPKLQELGEQAVLQKEIYATGIPAQDETVFGYQERYAEYRYRPSEIRGQFRSSYAQSLDVYHLAQEFENAPTLSGQFIQSETPIERSLVVTDVNYPHLLIDLWFDYKHARPMMTYGIPATLGRF